MSATYISEAIEQLQSNIYMHVRHRALLHYTGNPIVDKNQLFFIQLPFLNGEALDEKQQISAVTVGVVHASLAEHDKIKELDATSKEQQLIVLAGDYYSGRYYQLLAQTGNIRLIQKLSKGIVTRCEQQTTVYEKDVKTIEGIIASLEVVECELIERFYEANYFEQFSPIMRATLTAIRINSEYQLIASGQPSLFGQALQQAIPVQDRLENLLQMHLENKKVEIEMHLSKMDFLQGDLKRYIEQLVKGICEIRKVLK